MRPGRFFWKLFLGNAILMALIIGVSAWLIIGEVEGAYREDLNEFLQTEAGHVRLNADALVRAGEFEKLRNYVNSLRTLGDAKLRVTVVSIDGTLLADSAAPPERWTPHGDRPEIVQAMRDGIGIAERHSDTVQKDMRYFALRMGSAEAPLGTVRVSMPVPSIIARTDRLNNLIYGTAALVLSAAVILALGLAYVWSNPIKKITEMARSLSRGELSARMEVHGRDEIAEMAASLNQMRDSLANQLRTIDRQRQNLEYLIHVLTEGVIVVDSQGQIVLINHTACRLIDPASRIFTRSSTGPGDSSSPNLDEFVGRRIEDCIPHTGLRDLLKVYPSGERNAADDRANRGGNGQADSRAIQEIPLQVRQPSGVMHLLARGTDIELEANTPSGRAGGGRLVVLTDITELTETIRMKTDFVANASHELRTPLSTIRASVETLQQMDMKRDENSARNFMQVIDRHTSRLEELVSDLLDLSRLEASTTYFPPERLHLPDFLRDLEARFAAALHDRRLTWRAACPDDCAEIVINGRLLQLVLDNLVSNAIKFTEDRGQVSVLCQRLEGSFRLEVSDTGCGIATEDQPRVFERFYQVERARSDKGRAHGKRGTGLGLSIVRHAVLAMGGSIQMRSQPGQGTSITVVVPMPA